MVKFYVKSNGVAVIKTMNGKGFLKGNEKYFEGLKEKSTPKASRLIAKVLREIRRKKYQGTMSRKDFNLDEMRDLYRLINMSSDDLKIELYENGATKNNRSKRKPCKNLFDYNQSVNIKGIVD